MDNIKRLDSVIKDGKWIKNDIGMGRVQCAKAIILNSELILIISSEVNAKPVWARVEKILLINNEITLFYDGEYCEEIDKEEYREYSGFIQQLEWNIIFESGSTAKLEAEDLISSTDGFYVDVHENIENYKEEFVEEESERLNSHFNL